MNKIEAVAKVYSKDGELVQKMTVISEYEGELDENRTIELLGSTISELLNKMKNKEKDDEQYGKQKIQRRRIKRKYETE